MKKDSMMEIYHVRESGIGTILSEITRLDLVDAIVSDCRELQVYKTGEAIINSADGLPCRYIIETAVPEWSGGDNGEADQLAECYRNTLELAMDNGIRTIAFPSLAAENGSYPVGEAAYIAVNTVLDFLRDNPGRFILVFWALTSERVKAVYDHALMEAARMPGSDMGKAGVIITRSLDINDIPENIPGMDFTGADAAGEDGKHYLS